MTPARLDLSRAALLRLYDPNLSPRWRYERAAKLVKQDRSPHRRQDDSEVVALRKLCKAHRLITLRTENQEEARRLLMIMYADEPGLYFAFESALFEVGIKTRMEIEARVLARQSVEEIAQILKTQPDMVRWYEACFFDVRPFLENDGYIRNQVIWPSLVESVEDMTFDMPAKWFAYYGGPTVLDHVLRCYDEAAEAQPTPGASTQDWMDGVIRSNLAMHVAKSSTHMDVNKYNLHEILGGYLSLRDQVKKSDKDGAILNPIERSVQVFLSGAGWAAGDYREAALEQSPFKQYYGLPGEPRADELMRVAGGEALVLDAELARALPPPPVREELNEGAEQGS